MPKPIRSACAIDAAIAAAFAALIAAGAAQAQPIPPNIPKKVCSPIPSDWRLAPKPLEFDEVDKKLSETHRAWKDYRRGRQSHDQYREFSDGKQRGILVTRTGCLNSFFITR